MATGCPVEFRCLRKFIAFHKRKINKEFGNIPMQKLINRHKIRHFYPIKEVIKITRRKMKTTETVQEITTKII